MGGRMDTQQLLKRGQRRIVINEIRINPLGDQMIIDGGKTLRTLRVMRTHIVQLTVAMGDEGSGCHLFSFSLRTGALGGARRNAIIVPFPQPLQALESDLTAFTKTPMPSHLPPSSGQASHSFTPILAEAEKIVLGKAHEIRLATACLLAGGHLLIEDLPGMGKTTLAQTLARLLGLRYSRIQFTSDLLPADITGISVFERDTATFRFLPGPVFAQLVLADEINRATPKTQSALLEAMEEGQVTAEGETRPLPTPFFVIATQNPAHQIGTFPLPESQLDRFLMRIELGYPDRAAERALLTGGGQHGQISKIAAQLDPAQIPELQAMVANIHAAPPLIDYIQALIEASRQNPAFQHGLSPRAGLGLLAAARAWAWLAGRQMVLPDDVQAVFPAVARHRLLSRHGGGHASAEEIADLLRSVAIP